MNESEFWKIIQNVHSATKDNMDAKCAVLVKEVSQLSPGDATDFYEIFHSLDIRAYTWELWGAAYVIHGGCSDDTFSDFRASLISRGEDAFERGVKDPDSIADNGFDEDFFYEGFQYAVSEGVKRVLGSLPPYKTPFPSDPSGVEWDEESVRDLYPKLSERFE
jgi:hypothetical protein